MCSTQVIGISLIVQCCAISQASGPNNVGPGLFMSIGGSIAVLAYTLTPLGVYFKELARFDQMADTESTDTAGTTFEQASVDQGLPMPWYICPVRPHGLRTRRLCPPCCRQGG